MAWRFRHLLLACAGLLSAPPAIAALQGDHPPFSYYEIGIQVYPQNFAIAQDNRSFVYLGNTNGVVIYDGEQWQLAELPNKLHVRALKTDANNRIYVGGYDQFGYMEMDDRGSPRFHDLTHLFKDRLGGTGFADIWDVLVTPQGVFFRALRHLFLYDPRSGNTGFWEHEGRFGAIAWYRDAPLLQFRGQGFKQLRQGEWRLVSGTESLTSQIHTVLPLPDGGLLGIGVDPEWREINEQGVIAHPMPPGFPPADTVVSGIVAPDGTLIMGTRDGFVHFYDPAQNSHHSVNVDQGFLPDVILGRDGVVLTVGDSGFYAIPWPSEWTRIDASNGLKGSFERIRQHGDNWYVLGSGGIFQSITGGTFIPLNWTSHEAWDLMHLDDGTALFAESYRLLWVRKDGLHPLSDDTLYPRLLHPSRFHRDIVYVGTENGVAILQQRADDWLLVHPPALRGVRVNSIVEISAGEIWAGSEGAGLYRLSLARPGQADAPWREAATEVGREQGITYGQLRDAWVAESPAGDVLVSTRRGLYQWDSARFIPTQLGGLGALRGPDELLRLAWSADGSAWAYSDNRVFIASGNEWTEKEASRILHGAFQSLSFDGQRAIFGGNASVMILDAGVNQADLPLPKLSLIRVELERRSGVRERLVLASRPELARGDGWLHIEFSLPDLNRPQSVRYQSRLLPLETGFSEWSESNRLSYFDLAPGQYRLLMRARDSHGNVIERPPFDFSVIPPWYATAPARLALGVLLLLLFMVAAQALARRRSRALATENLRLEGMVTVRTRELESANRQLDSLAHLDSLTEIPNRRRLETYLKEVWQLSVERGRELAVAIVDVDHFKQYNDTHGHLQGDKLLKEVAGVLSHSLRRAEDLVARYGGEEFLLVFPGADSSITMSVAETVRKRIADSDFGITVSIGVAVSSPEKGGDIQALLVAADAALYAAKNGGRNRVVMAP